MVIDLERQVQLSCRHLLSEINRDACTPTHGCFDRRYWAWKLTDFPEATYQRNLASLAWYMQACNDESDKEMIREVVIAGLLYAAKIQHGDGSFDQAYPNEKSFGATGFLLPDLIKAYLSVKDSCDERKKERIEECLQRASGFLCRHAEQHGLISNHLAGAALGLFMAEDFFQDKKYGQKGRKLLDSVLCNQSSEGWFPEYGGADPGYQTLCMHYLAQIYKLLPSSELKNALQCSLEFLQYFLHPDGSFGGEYGSRRTEVYYPGGIALLADEFSLAAVMHRFMRDSIEHATTVTLIDIDMGNTAPLLSSTILSLGARCMEMPESTLPFQQDQLCKSFPQAGIAVYATRRYYALVGASNGGVLKIFDKQTKKLVEDDCGLLAETQRGKWISTQATFLNNTLKIKNNIFNCESKFYSMSRAKTTPVNYLGLRLINLTVMRIGFLNELVKKLMVFWLIEAGKPEPLVRKRSIHFLPESVEINDHYMRTGRLKLKRLWQAGKFNAIHMASSRYYSGNLQAITYEPLDHQSLNVQGRLKTSKKIAFEKSD